MARAALRWSVRDLAAHAGVAASTVNRFEVGSATPIQATLAAMRRAMEEHGVRFTAEGAVLPPAGEG